MTPRLEENCTRRPTDTTRYRRRGIKSAITAVSRIQRLAGEDDCGQEWGELLDLLAHRSFTFRVLMEGPQHGWLTGVLVFEIVLDSAPDLRVLYCSAAGPAVLAHLDAPCGVGSGARPDGILFSGRREPTELVLNTAFAGRDGFAGQNIV